MVGTDPCYKGAYNNILLVLFTKKVVDSLYWVKCGERNLDKYCIPVRHGTVPQSRKFEGL